MQTVRSPHGAAGTSDAPTGSAGSDRTDGGVSAGSGKRLPVQATDAMHRSLLKRTTDGTTGRRERRGARRLVEAAGQFTPEALEARVLMAADPITPDHPLWIVPRGAAVIDGIDNDAGWVNAGEVFRTQATRDDNAVVVKMMYDDNGVYLLAVVQDEHLWADGLGSGTGNRWEIETDDSITFFFDPDNSRDEYLQASDRAFGVNLGNDWDSVNGSGAVKRWKYVTGTGNGGAPDVNPGGSIADGMAYATVVNGTVNNDADTDGGWVTEMFLPWAALNMSGAPVHGQTIGLNFQMIQDNSGGDRDLTDHRDAGDRFLVPHFVDDYVDGVASSYTASQAGIRGPVNYAEAMFIDPRAGAQPAAITAITATSVSVFGAKLNFTAPAGTTGGSGHVSGYEIRYSTSPITTDAAWGWATKFENAYVPRLRGLAESVRITELGPSTTYYVAVRAVDGAGNLGDLSGTATFTTLALPSVGYKGAVIVSPNGRTLQFENGEAFVPVGDHLGISWQYTRTLFPGLIWDDVNDQFLDFSDGDHTAVEDIDAYLDELAAHGVNTMRTYLELENVHVAGNPGPLPSGTYWIENTPGVFNTNMRQYVWNLLEKASARGIYVILSPFDTFSYDEAFGVEGPWAQSRGGPLTTPDHFFQSTLGTPNLGTLELAKTRMQTVISWVNASAYKTSVLGYEFLSEWDSYEWTLHPSGGGEPGRETEFRTRAAYMNELAAFVKMQAPQHLVMNSTIARDPRGPLARLDFLSRNFDVLTPHLYTNANEEPINNPQTYKEVMAAREMGYFTAYWVSNRIDRAPVINGEWGMTRVDWPGGIPQYSGAFSQADDERLFRSVIWSGFASGQVGTGLRISTNELEFNGMLLTDGMRDLQKTFSAFVASTSLAIDFTDFTYDNLSGRMDASSAAGKSLLAWGVSDGTQGVFYVMHDRNSSSGTVSDGVLSVRGLRADQIVDIEVWSTAAGSTGPLTTISGVFVGTGDDLVIELPAFAQDVAIKFKGRAAGTPSQTLTSIAVGDSFVTFVLGPDAQPSARVVDANGNVLVADVASIGAFRGRVRDMTAYTTSGTDVHLAMTDEDHHLWVIHGNIASNTWWSENLTAGNGEAGMTGDLTTYQPSWGAVHIAGLDARGHAINYWWAPAEPYWHFTDLTGSFGGPTLEGGLTGYVSGWDGLNLAGLDASNNIIVYWWAPGIEHINGGNPGGWLAQNMTSDFGGPQFVGQLDAYVTPWGGLNVAGATASGELWSYWWAPGLDPEPNRWRVTNLSAEAGLNKPILPGVEVTISPGDGGINVFGRAGDGHLHGVRWKPGDIWRTTDITGATGNALANIPMSGASTGNRLLLAANGDAGTRTVVVFNFLLDSLEWTAENSGMLIAS
jgi:hypothetical protein